MRTCVTLLIVILAAAATFTIASCSYQNASKQGEIIEINKEQLQTKIDSKESFFVYVGRPNCPDCQKFYPEFEEKVNSASTVMYYFNTKVKVSKKAEMGDFVKSFGIDEIPAVLKIKDGQVERVFDGQTQSDIDDLYELL